MPLYDLRCDSCGATVSDKFFHVRPTVMPSCARCGTEMSQELSAAPMPLTKTYAEDRGVVDLHIRRDGKPQLITSWGQRQRLMRENGLEEAGVRRGEKGCWT